jgi:pyridoxine/pyridoxamine 5'-phosphate oxidase
MMKGYPMEITNLGMADGLPPVDWAAVAEKLDARSAPAPDAANSRTTWLSTINEDGSPHVTAVGAPWVDGAFWFQTGDPTRKAKNVARDPRCSLSVSAHEFDLVIEGTAEKITDTDTIARVKSWASCKSVRPEASCRGALGCSSCSPCLIFGGRGVEAALGS